MCFTLVVGVSSETPYGAEIRPSPLPKRSFVDRKTIDVKRDEKLGPSF